jgi:polysaccharide export outer membrane protein
MLSSIGGLLPTASRRIKVMRRAEFGTIPLPGAVKSPDGTFSSVMISFASLRENINPAEDIVLMPFDVISVERAEEIYVTGEVGHKGAFPLDERDSMSLVQILTLAGGLSLDASADHAYILRPVSDTPRRAEIPLNVKRILAGKDDDFPLLPNDLLVVPRSGLLRRNIGRVLGAAATIALSLAIYAVVR